MAKVKKETEGIVHLIVACVECGSLFEDYTKQKEAHEIAKKHVEKTAHQVNVEIGIATVYVAKTQTNKARCSRISGLTKRGQPINIGS